MKKFQYDISVIISAYNAENFIRAALNSLIEQDYDFRKIQVIVINDGSTDKTLDIIKEYGRRYPNIKVINQKHQGLVKGRNKGLATVNGKYILYLDADDMLTPDTVGSIISFFDKHYDEIDVVTYKIIPMLNGKPKALHYRYQYLTTTNIYDLRDPAYYYASLTTINYCVKNKGKNNILFDENMKEGQEDLKYGIDIVKKNMKIGYVSEGQYLYTQHPKSMTKTHFHAYYLFDSIINLWEEIFKQYDNRVPGYFQALFVNDVAWKTKVDILKPYQYEGEKFDYEYGRIIKLLNHVEDNIIINHPGFERYLKYYLISKKTNNHLSVHMGDRTSTAIVMNHNVPIFVCQRVELTFLKLSIYQDKIKMLARIGSPLFLFSENPVLYLIKNQDYAHKEEMKLRKSSYNYFDAKEEIAKCWLFELEIDVSDIDHLEFKIKLGKDILNVVFEFRERLLFNDRLKRYQYYDNHVQYWVKNIRGSSSLQINRNKDKAVLKEERKFNKKFNKTYYASNKKTLLVRKLVTKKIKRFENVWLYYDAINVKKDNGYYQFIHDLKKSDGVRRYYITKNTKRENREIFTAQQLKRVIPYDSRFHKYLYLKAKKVITSFIEFENCFPYTSRSFSNYADIVPMDREVVYLQHGVLHCHMPWKFSLDRMLGDRQVISTHFERKNLMKNYTFTDEYLIPSGMPRYDYVNQEAKAKNKILFAPSWRNNLIAREGDCFVADDERFLNSTFYKETSEFLNSPKLHKLLEKYNFTLDFQLHPIFQTYQHLYELKNDRVTFENAHNEKSDYQVFITDYSSFVFDFVYLKRPILYFFPDYDLFKAGMHVYREIDLPFTKGFGSFSRSHEEIIKKIEILLKNNGVPKKKYLNRMNQFFIHNDDYQCDRVYEWLLKK